MVQGQWKTGTSYNPPVKKNILYINTSMLKRCRFSVYTSAAAFTQNAFGAISRLSMSSVLDRYVYPAYPLQPVAHHPLSKF